LVAEGTAAVVDNGSEFIVHHGPERPFSW
jgi:hypothetical protein